MTDYYDRFGEPMPNDWWDKKKHPKPSKWAVDPRVGNTVVGEYRVSTVWLGLDHQYGNGAPLIFETMVFGGEWENELTRYSDEEQAMRGHLAVLDRLRDGRPPFAHCDKDDA